MTFRSTVAVLMFLLFLPITLLTGNNVYAEVVAFYDFEGNLDDTGTGIPLNMTQHGELTYDSDTPVSGLGFVFGGTSLRLGPPWSFGYVTPETNLKLELDTFTVEAWVKSSGSATQQVVFAYQPSGAYADGRGFRFLLGEDGTVRIGIGISGNPFQYAIGNTSIPLGSWHHVAATYSKDTGLTEIFVDGALDGVAIIGAIVYANNGTLGPYPKAAYVAAEHDALPTGPELAEDYQFAGLVDRVQIHDTVLGSAELDYNYPFIQNQLPVAEAGENQTVECAGPLTQVALDGSTSSDPDGDEIEYEWSVPEGVLLDNPFSTTPTGLFPLGPTLVTLTVTDGNGGVAVDDVLITVQDTQPPVVVCTTDIASLFPPNHRMVDVTVRVQASDICVCPESLLLRCVVSSNEPDDGSGDGSTVGDVNGLDGYASPVLLNLEYDEVSASYVGTVALRAERDGTQSGRTYSIVAEVMDISLNSATAGCVVVVPHDKRKK